MPGSGTHLFSTRCTTPLSRALKILALVLGAVALVIVVLFAALIGYGMYGESASKGKATDLCASATAGSDASGLPDRAIQLGAVRGRAHWREVEGGENELVAIFPGTTPRSGYQCAILAKDGRVTVAAVTALD